MPACGTLVARRQWPSSQQLYIFFINALHGFLVILNKVRMQENALS